MCTGAGRQEGSSWRRFSGPTDTAETAMYGQFCPVSKAMEILDERWTMLVLREMLMGSTRFNELRRGVPRMSPALLSKRLASLERAGVVRREGSGVRTSYH